MAVKQVSGRDLGAFQANDGGAQLCFTENDGLEIFPKSGRPALKVVPSGPTPSSTSTGGAINVDNTNADGAGIVLFSSHGAGATGRLLVVRGANKDFDQNLAYFEGIHGSFVVRITRPAAVVRSDLGPSGSVPASNALSVAVFEPSNNDDSNVLDSAVGISGFELDRGTLKVTHNRPTHGASNDDSNAAAISVNLLGTGTKAQALFIDTGNSVGPQSYPDGSKLVNIRVNGNERLAIVNKGTDGTNLSNLLVNGIQDNQVGGGAGGIGLKDRAVQPGSASVGGGFLYSQGGQLRWRGPTTDTAIVGP